jgi:hypothetical protein
MLKNKLLAAGVLAGVLLSVPAPMNGGCPFQIPNPGWVYMYSSTMSVPPCVPPDNRPCLIEYFQSGTGNNIPVPRACNG